MYFFFMNGEAFLQQHGWPRSDILADDYFSAAAHNRVKFNDSKIAFDWHPLTQSIKVCIL